VEDKQEPEIEPEEPEIEEETVEEPEVIEQEIMELEEIEPQPEPVEEQPIELADEPEKEEPDLEIEVPEEPAIEAPTQQQVMRDDVYEVETIKSAVRVKKDRSKEVKKQFSSIVKNFKVDLGKRSQKIKEQVETEKEERKSQGNIKKVKTIVTDNSELFKQRQLAAKWKHFPMSRSMTRSYIPRVMDVIKPYWNLPLEMDPSLEILVKLKIAKSGTILDYEFVESSRNRFFNHSVIQVFKNLNQLPPLPEGFSGESTEIGLRFTSKQNNNE